MKSVIYKYLLEHGINRLEMPSCARSISVAAQHNQPVLWVFIDDRRLLRSTRTYRVVMTGEDFDRNDTEKYVGTLTCSNGIVMHVFEFIKDE